MTTMNDLTAFITARLDEDELAARNVGGEVWDFTGVNCEVRVRPSGRKEYGDFGRVIAYCRHGNPVQDDLALAVHIAYHDPARALREVAVKRAILAAHQPLSDEVARLSQPGGPWCGTCGDAEQYSGHPWPCDTVKAIAAIWSDHADYQKDEWVT